MPNTINGAIKYSQTPNLYILKNIKIFTFNFLGDFQIEQTKNTYINKSIQKYIFITQALQIT